MREPTGWRKFLRLAHPIILLAIATTTLNSGKVKAQTLPKGPRVTEPVPDQRTLAFAQEYGCSIVKVLMKQYPQGLKKGVFSSLVEQFSATGFYADSKGDVATATHTFFFVPPDKTGFIKTKAIINYDGSTVVFDGPSAAEIEDGRLSDILILHTNKTPPCFLSFLSLKLLKPGQELFTIGFPSTHNDYYVLDGVQHQRPLAQRGYFIARIQGEYGPLLQIEMYGAQGASGSPIMTSDGKVVGVSSEGSTRRTVLLASPIDEASGIINLHLNSTPNSQK